MVPSAPTHLIRLYEPTLKPQWNAFVEASKNGTFLFQRDYMDYHRDRFCDRSLLIFADAELVALLPANQKDDELHSHEGLTYGGFIVSADMTTSRMLVIFKDVLAWLQNYGIRRLWYKTIPSIYHQAPSEEDRYALFRHDAHLYRRDVLSVVPMQPRLSRFSTRTSGAAKAEKAGVQVGQSDNWREYWTVLGELLERKFHTSPTHSLAEMELLSNRFQRNIKLYAATLRGEVVAGVVIYESARVAHVQYIASSAQGRKVGALDLLFVYLLDEIFSRKPFFDFGASNEKQGRVLNLGLIEQKEGFGARAITHDFYRVDLRHQLEQ